jgi:dTDP-4-amino-4,6-dideoxygalactose transaminase
VTLRVPFVDLKQQVAALRPELDEAIARVLGSGLFILGPELEAFERELAEELGASEAVGVACGTDAIALALEVAGVGPGDEVITTPLTAAFTALAIQRIGARPVFADVDDETLSIAPASVARLLGDRTRALLPVHLYGHPADLDALIALARPRSIALVEDACQAHGARYRGRPVGSYAGLGALSFYPTKNLGALGDGGAVLVDDRQQAMRLRMLRNGGQADRYRHELAGVNSRLDEIQAAILRAELRHLGSWNARRRALAAVYLEELEGAGLRLPREQPYADAVHHLFVVRHPQRDQLAERLRARGVGTLIHYPIPLHLQPAFSALGGRRGDLPAAERAADEVLSLPLHPGLSDDQVRLVARAVREIVSSL